MDETQWQGLVEAHAPLVWRTAFRLVGQEADASDCVQETFLGAWKLAQRQPVRNWAGLLQHLATVRALDVLRRRQSARRNNSPRELSALPSKAPCPAATAESAELATELRRALAQLPAIQGEIYCLRHLNDLTYEEIAGELGVSISLVSVNLHRATRRLREILSPSHADSSEVNHAK